MKSGAKVTASDEKGWTPLHVAALKGNRAAGDYLIAHGADVDAADEDGWTPLHVAAMQGNDPMVDLLVYSRAKVNVGDTDGWTPAKKNAAWIVQRLIDAGADIFHEASEFDPGCVFLSPFWHGGIGKVPVWHVPRILRRNDCAARRQLRLFVQQVHRLP